MTDPRAGAPDRGTAAEDLARARLLVDLSRPEDAVPLLHRALAAEPTSVGALLLLGWAEQQRGEPARALDAWERCAALASDVPAAHIGRSRALAALDRRRDAVRAAREGVRLAPDWPVAQAQLALTLRRCGLRRREARRAADRAVALAPEDPGGHAVVGDVALAQGRRRAAARAYRRALALDPEHLSARHNLGLVALHRGNLPAAAQAFLSVATEDRTAVARGNLEITVWKVLSRLHLVLLLAAVVFAFAVREHSASGPSGARPLAFVAVLAVGGVGWLRVRRVPVAAWRFARETLLRRPLGVLCLGALVVGAAALVVGLVAPRPALQPAGATARFAALLGFLLTRVGAAEARR